MTVAVLFPNRAITVECLVVTVLVLDEDEFCLCIDDRRGLC